MSDEIRERITEKEERDRVIRIFGEMATQIDSINEIKEDQKEMLEMFVEQNPKWTVKQIKVGYKYFKALVNDRQKTTEAEMERDQMVELISQVMP